MTELNAAIIDVMIHQFKKDMKESYKIVENAGLRITKYDGKFNISNDATHRWCYMTRIWDSWKGGYRYDVHWGVTNGNGRKSYKTNDPKTIPFDFYRMLNMAYGVSLYNYSYRSPAVEKGERIRSKKYVIKSGQREIEVIKERIRKDQEKLISLVREVEEDKYELKELKKKYGLS